MQTYRLVIGPDGQVRIPDGKPGQTVVVVVETPATTLEPEKLTLATAKTPEEREEVIARMQENARKLRELMKDDLPSPGTEELYDEDGLPA